MTDDAKFNRFSISITDFEKAEAFLVESKRHQYGDLIHEALVFSAIICYFRPFTHNEKDPASAAAAKLELSDFPPLSSDELLIHEACKELRNKALAHAEIKFYPTQLNRETGIISSATFSLVGKAPNLDALTDLVRKLISECHNERADYVRSTRNSVRARDIL